MDQTLSVEFVSAVFSVLLTGNLFFIKKLVEKVDGTAQSATAASVAAANAAASADSVSAQMREIKNEIKDLRRVEIDVAILKAQLGLTRRDEKDA